ncbi:diguanylate cyclase [Enterobacter quasihormaechei]|uniref:diguanylate cyclase n=1 Tax=Enterobacter quasihormaechei TaxID=2529382 RepID=A0ABU9PLI0_9ENTR
MTANVSELTDLIIYIELTPMKKNFPGGKLNFRKPVNILFLCLVGLTLIGIAIAGHLQWQEQQNIYDKLSLDMVTNARIDFELAFGELDAQLGEMAHVLESAKAIDNIFSGKPHIQRYFMSALALIPTASSFYIADTRNRFIHVPYIHSDDDFVDNLTSRPWFIQPDEQYQRIRYSSVYKDWFTNKDVFTLSRRILEQGNYYGVMGVDIDVTGITSVMNKMKVTLSGDVYLINEKGQRILGNEKKWQPLRDEQLSRFYGAEGIISDTENGRKIYYSNLLYPEWTMLIIADCSVQNKTMLQESIMPAVTLLTMVGLLVVAWWRSLLDLHFFYFRLASTLNSDASRPMDVDKLLETELIKNQVTIRNIEQKTRTDSLTGLLNRHAFDDDINKLISLNTDRLTLALIDLDNFKTINDTFGHHIGDDVLKAFASAARSGLDEAAARLYRYGGEEFAVIFAHISPEQARDMLDSVRLAFSSRKWREGMEQVSFSAGMKTRFEESAVELISAADSCLYAAKHSGKNKIVDNHQAGDAR